MQEFGTFVVDNIWILLLVISLMASKQWRPVGYIILTILSCAGTISSALLVLLMVIVIILTVVTNYREIETRRKKRSKLNRLIDLQTKRCKNGQK